MTKKYRKNQFLTQFILIMLIVFLMVSSKQILQPLSQSPVSGQLRPLDERYTDQKSSLDNIKLESAWDLTTGSSEIIVAIIDDAIDINHPDLRDNMMAGYDFVDGDNDPSPGLCADSTGQNQQLEQHGTQVAGIIGATGNNNQGISGINWQVKIMPLRIGCYYPSNLEAQAVKYAIDNGAHIINASYGGPDLLARNERVIELLKNAKQQVLFITAAGNFHVNNDEIPVYPGNIGLPNVITVAASDNRNQLTEWTQYGASSVDLSAPGVDLQTTRAGGSSLGEYGKASGSSFSTAVVSGVAALIKSYDFNKRLLPTQLKAVIQASVSPIDGQNARNKTSGVINARAALDMLAFPQPVLSIIDTTYTDEGQQYDNGLIDSDEFGNVIVKIENLWADMVTGTITVSVDSPFIQIPTTFYNLSPMIAGEQREIIIPIQSNNFNGHQRIRFHLTIDAIGTDKNVTYKRSFELQTGELSNNIQISARIQQNDYDDYQYYHLNIPPNMDRVALELEYDVSDTRDMGLLAAFDQRPLIHFRGFNGLPYWYSAKYRGDKQTGFERIDILLPKVNASNLKVMVFNKPPDKISDNFAFNKSYKIKGCFFSDSDGNSPPLVNAGPNRSIKTGESVILTGEISDRDGNITRSYWQSNNNVEFVILNNNQIQFTAPSSGDYTFSLVAFDNGCKKTVDFVTISVDEVNGNEPNGLFLNPSTLQIDESSGFDVLVAALYNSREVTGLTMISAPAGVKYENGNISWQNAGPAGTYLIKFSAIVNNQTLLGNIRVDILSRQVGNGGGGCVAMKNDKFDPLLLIYVLLSSLFIHKKTVFRKNST